ncbi:alpha/beta fold hydrolase [Bradyrhizobium sp. AUGA SZCCT0182]|uniref:alpha/beta fold hydrolase n=1 Tax=Bradyrhizobium sp. AUGA SZCCT0182 TaxID=2807667 RepID=UPI001BA44E89|nr:alpha/beta fold hydrolase [Bradyrhizobium sp. AUGA SZCCT0182]MBR1231649.1 alpha/beta fold hydrolase [Bradyrhizobium sp. AUGA SZCCT0182]
MATFILIHGAWHGGWCWEHVAPLLTAEGHQVLPPDLPGMGADTSELGSDPLSDWADFVADLASRAEAPVILVGHSRGGLVISEVAERVPDRIDTLVYLTAFLLKEGQSLVDVAGRYPDVGPGAVIQPAADPSCLVVDLEPALPIFYGRTSEALARAAAKRLTPEPTAALTTPVKISAERFGRVARVYIEATDDLVISLEMQREMQAALPCERVITLDSDHSPFYSTPAALAAALLGLF